MQVNYSGDDDFTGNDTNKTFHRLDKATFEHHGIAKFNPREWELILAMTITSCAILLIAFLAFIFCLRPTLGPFLKDKLDLIHDLEKAKLAELARLHAEEIRLATRKSRFGKKWIPKRRKPSPPPAPVGKTAQINTKFQSPHETPKYNPIVRE